MIESSQAPTGDTVVRGSIHVGFVLPPYKARVFTQAIKDLALQHGASVIIDQDVPRSTRLPGLDDDINELLTAGNIFNIDQLTGQTREELLELDESGQLTCRVVRYLAKQDPPRVLAGTTTDPDDQLELLELDLFLLERVRLHYDSISALVESGGVALSLVDRLQVERFLAHRRLHWEAIPVTTPLSAFGFDEDIADLLFKTAGISPDTPVGDLAASVLLMRIAQNPQTRLGSTKLKVRQIRRVLGRYGIELRQHPATRKELS